MFGIIRPCKHRLSGKLRTEWMAHLCGLCLALRDDHGQLARTATNYDGLIISVLVDAQRPKAAAGRRVAGPCPLRGMRTAEVARGDGARLAAAVSLALASVKVRDHVLDADGLFARRPVAVGARAVARRWDRQSAGSGAVVGFDTGVLLTAAARQESLERSAVPGGSVLLVTEPTESATAAAFAHTAVLAGRPQNAAALSEAGRLFGRLAHLLDAAEDEAADGAAGAWNPLTATGTARAEAERLCRDAVRGIRLALKDVEFTDRVLAHLLLGHETGQAVDRVFGHGANCALATHACGTHPSAVYDQPPFGAPLPPPRRSRLAGCAMWTLMACTCQLLCCEHEDPLTRQRRKGWCERNDCGSGCCDASGEGCCQCSCNCCCEGCSDGCSRACDGCDCCDCWPTERLTQHRGPADAVGPGLVHWIRRSGARACACGPRFRRRPC